MCITCAYEDPRDDLRSLRQANLVWRCCGIEEIQYFVPITHLVLVP